MSDLLIKSIEALRNEERIRVWREKKSGAYRKPKKESHAAGWLFAASLLILTALLLKFSPPEERVITQNDNVTIVKRVE